MGDHETLFIVRDVELHSDFSFMKSSLDLSVFTFMCEVNLDGLHPFDQWELLNCDRQMPLVVGVKWPLAFILNTRTQFLWRLFLESD